MKGLSEGDLARGYRAPSIGGVITPDVDLRDELRRPGAPSVRQCERCVLAIIPLDHGRLCYFCRRSKR